MEVTATWLAPIANPLAQTGVMSFSDRLLAPSRPETGHFKLSTAWHDLRRLQRAHRRAGSPQTIANPPYPQRWIVDSHTKK